MLVLQQLARPRSQARFPNVRFSASSLYPGRIVQRNDDRKKVGRASRPASRRPPRLSLLSHRRKKAGADAGLQPRTAAPRCCGTMKAMRTVSSLLMLCGVLASAQKYTGPRPPKPDVLYLMHADN